MRSRKETAWKKSRKFGDVYGGRMAPKLADKIFRRAHSLQRPAPNAALPIVIEDNPSRDFFFPLNAAEACQALDALPHRDTVGITHVWLRRFRKSDYARKEVPFAEFICGSGVRLIVLYPWPRDMLLHFGKRKPADVVQRTYRKWDVELIQREGSWAMKWNLRSLRKFYIEHLLFHEVGHHIDRYVHHWSKANHRDVEAYANRYAMSKTATATYVFNELEKARDDREPPERG